MRHLKRPPVNTLKEITSKTGSKCQLPFCSYFLFANSQLAFSATSFQNLALSVRNVTSMAIFDLEQQRKLAKLFMLPIAVRSTSSLHILRCRRNHIPFKRAGCVCMWAAKRSKCLGSVTFLTLLLNPISNFLMHKSF
jgi:hypothetical protein